MCPNMVPTEFQCNCRRVANWYFTIVAALSLTEFSPVRYLSETLKKLHALLCSHIWDTIKPNLICRPWTTFLPLVFVIGVSVLKEGLEDRKRHKADYEVNNKPVDVIDVQTRTTKTIKWNQVRVGDVLHVRCPMPVLCTQIERMCVQN